MAVRDQGVQSFERRSGAAIWARGSEQCLIARSTDCLLEMVLMRMIL